MMELTTAEEIIPVLEKYNYFHDAFVKAMVITSSDSFFKDKQGEIVKDISGNIALKLLLAHYNYEPKPESLDEVIALSFGSVKSLVVNADIHDDPMGFDITKTEISSAKNGLLKLTMTGGRAQNKSENNTIFSVVFANLQFSVEKEEVKQ